GTVVPLLQRLATALQPLRLSTLQSDTAKQMCHRHLKNYSGLRGNHSPRLRSGTHCRYSHTTRSRSGATTKTPRRSPVPRLNHGQVLPFGVAPVLRTLQKTKAAQSTIPLTQKIFSLP